jgi:hypothetical protein
MAINWDELKDTSDTDPPFCTFYGGAKTGKTTLASEFPAPLYVRTGEGERAPAGVTMKSLGVSESYADVLDQMAYMSEAEHDRRTFVLDALDGLELHIRAEACARNGWANIEEPGYGKGYAAEQSIWHDFIKECLKLKKAGFYVVLLSHVKVKTEPGVTSDSYPRYRINLRDDAGSAIADASDLIGFIHQRVSIKKEELGFKKTNNRGEGAGEINIAVQERPGYIAGNRYEISKPTLPFKKGAGFAVLSEYFPKQGARVAEAAGEE